MPCIGTYGDVSAELLRTGWVNELLVVGYISPSRREIDIGIGTGRATKSKFSQLCSIWTRRIMCSSGPLQHLKMPPLKVHAVQRTIASLRESNACVVGFLFQCSVEIVGRRLGSQGKFVQDIKELEGRASFDIDLRCRIQSSSKQLDMLRDGSRAIAKINRYLVETVNVHYDHVAMAWRWVFAVHTAMVELDSEAHRFQRHLRKLHAVPFLSENH